MNLRSRKYLTGPAAAAAPFRPRVLRHSGRDGAPRLRVTRQIFSFAVSIFLFSTFLYAEEKLVAANYSDRYHVASCKVAKKIHPDDLVKYKSPQEAVEAGLAPCKKCNPPVPADYKKTAQNF